MTLTIGERFQNFLKNVVFADRDQISEADFMKLAEERGWPQVWPNQPKFMQGTSTVVAMAMEASLLRWRDYTGRILELQTPETWAKYAMTQEKLDAQSAAAKARKERENPSLEARLRHLEQLAGPVR